MEIKVSELCELVEGELHGWGDAVVTGVASLDKAGPGDVTFAKRERLKDVAKTGATAILVPEVVTGVEIPQIVVENPYFAFGKILRLVVKEQSADPKGIHPAAVIGEGVKLGKDVGLGPYAVIGNGCVLGDGVKIYPNTTIGPHCVIGDETVIHSNTAVREYTRIGKRCVIHTCTSIGGDGFGFLPTQGQFQKIPQVGIVEIGDDVEIGCNCTVDRATMDKTIIGNGVKIDNHSHLAHNCEIGDNSILVAYARLGGSTILGRNVILTEDVGVTNGVKLGDGCIVGATAKVSRSWPAGTMLLGSPAQPAADEKRQIVLIKKLPRLYDTLRKLKETVEKKLGENDA